MMIDRSPGPSPASRNTAWIAAITPRSGASGVVRILALNRSPAISSATSVKVPPISTPSRPFIFSPAATPRLVPPRKAGECSASATALSMCSDLAAEQPIDRQGAAAADQDRDRDQRPGVGFDARTDSGQAGDEITRTIGGLVHAPLPPSTRG